MQTQTDDYQDLIDRVRRFENSAMDKLVERFGTHMERIAYSLVGKAIQSQLDPADAVQAVQLAMWVGIRTGRFAIPTPHHFLNLARTLLRRHIARFWRKAKYGRTLPLHGELQADGLSQGPFTSCKNLPAQAIDTNEFLERFLHQIDDTDRLLVKMRFLGFTTAEAAKQMKCVPGSLRMRLQRLRGRFVKFHSAHAGASADLDASALWGFVR